MDAFPVVPKPTEWDGDLRLRGLLKCPLSPDLVHWGVEGGSWAWVSMSNVRYGTC